MSAGPQDWGAQPVAEGEGPAAWGAQEHPQEPQLIGSFGGASVFDSGETVKQPGGYLDRMARGFGQMGGPDVRDASEKLLREGIYAHDTSEIFKEGVQATLNAPGQFFGMQAPKDFDELHEDMRKKLISIGASEEEAKRESDFMVRRLQRNQGLLGGLLGPLQAITAPLFGPYRTMVSRPIEKETGFPKEATEQFSMAALATAGMIPHIVGRVKIGPKGVDVQAIGEMPKDVDFQASAKFLGGDYTEANLRRMWDEHGIHPAEAVHDALQDTFARYSLTAQPTFIEAYHGSPHDFERFDISKVGTGEGAQSYGHGLYFAQNAEVAKTYQVQRGKTPVGLAHQTKTIFGNNEDAIANLEQALKTPEDYGGEKLIRDAIDVLKSGQPIEANLYRVRINADPEHFLDWDKPLSEQSAHVRKVLEPLLREFGDKNTAVGEYLYRYLGRQEPVGEAGYKILQPADEAKASAILREAGIPGIKYLDQRSRTEGAGTRNFVVFDDKDVEITHRNGMPIKTSHIDPADIETLAETGGMPRTGLGADVTSMPPIDVPLSKEPPARAARLMTAAHDAIDKLFEIGRDIQILTAPMARGTTDSMAIAKDFANNLRRNRWDWSRMDSDIEKRFTPEQRKRMWDAADEESVLRQEGKTSEHMGLATLEPEERAAVEDLQTRAQAAWLRARDMGIVEGEGLPAYTPRMVINTAAALAEDKALPLNGIGQNLRTRTGQMMHRKYLTAEETEAAAKKRFGDEAEIARDIRALPLATARLEDAIAGRKLIDAIKEYGKRTGDETAVEGAMPTGTEQKWFTIDHPAFRKWRPKFQEKEGGGVEAVKDAEGNTVFEQTPIYVRGDFEGPLRAVLTEKNGALYNAAMAVKGKTMSLIMNSPLIHNAVEWGRAIPSMPGKVTTFRVYFEGNRARKDVATMHEAIDAGMVPIGHRFFNQDITSIMEAPDLAPGRSWTAKVLGFVPGLFDEGAGTAVKSAIDKAGNFWHNTLLWDRVADLQAGLYVNFRDEMLAKGVDRQTAARAAAHWANRYAGALPQEAMSNSARKIANMALFSRSFTMGNLGALKDMFTGLPKDVLAQIERDGGFRPGSIDAAEAPTSGAEAVSYAKSMARRKAMAIVALDMGLMYVGNSLLQNAANVMLNDSTLDKEFHGYAERFAASLQERSEHPLKLLQPFDFLQSLSATAENEPGKQDRIMIGHAKDGTAIYARNPVGKIGEEFIGWMTGQLDMMRKKMGTIARPAWQVMANDAGFGHKIYDPDADTPDKYLANLGLIAKHFAEAQFPTGQAGALSDLVKGEGDAKVNALQAFGPLAGVTFAKGAPGGPAVGEAYHARAQHDFAVQAELPDIRRQILRGDLAGATDRMTALGIPAGLQRFYMRTTIDPTTRLGGRTLKDFYLYATPEQKARMERVQ